MDIVKACKDLINEHSSGVLSTLSVKLGGFPFGSIVPFCNDQNGYPIIYISTIAEHTKNILADSRVSLFLASTDNSDVQAKGRATIVGNVELITDDEEVRERYYKYFPSSKRYSEMHSFNFYRIVPTTIRFIGGFGAIHWVDKAEYTDENPFWGETENQIISHMNTDHRSDLALYTSFYKNMTTLAEDSVEIVGIDTNGFDLLLNNNKIRFNFETPITTTAEARNAFVNLSKEARK